jgi:DNA-binding beta-propeller fold protein YncE
MLNRKLQSASSGISFADGAWDLSYAYYDDPKAWDLSTAEGTESLLISGKETLPTGIFFKPDGTQMYIIGTNSDAVHQYSVGNPWRMDNNVGFVRSFSVAAQEILPQSVFFKPDGTKMYILGDTGNDVNEYSLSTAWNISTASYVQVFSVAGQDTTPTGLYFKPDGTKMYVVGSSSDSVNEYNLSTAWNISTASYVQNFSVAAQDTVPTSVFFKPDGTKMYISGDTNNNYYEYSLSAAWDVSTASYVLSIPSQNTSPQGLFFRADGANFYNIDAQGDRVYQSALGGFSVAAQDSNPYGLFFKPDGTKMYIAGDDGNDINEYSLSTAWDTSTATFVRAKVIGDTSPRNLFFKPDGTVMLVVGNTSDAVYIYSLSTAWDISTASLTATRSISAQEITPTGIFVKPDGATLYICGEAGDDVNQYSMSPAWTGTLTFVQSKGVESQPSGIFFRPDGKRMYITRNFGNDDEVLEYHLSAPWDISSTGSYSQEFYLGNQGPIINGLSFSDDGTKMFILSIGPNVVVTYTLAPQP